MAFSSMVKVSPTVTSFLLAVAVTVTGAGAAAAAAAPGTGVLGAGRAPEEDRGEKRRRDDARAGPAHRLRSRALKKPRRGPS